MIDSFIPAELAVAPNPLGLAPHLKLTTIPIDAYACFELWMPTTNTALLPEEAALLRGDRSRLEEICARLTWLLGAKLIGCKAEACQSLIYDWCEVQRLLQQYGREFNVIGVTYLPQMIYPDLAASSWTLRPASWKVSLLNLKAVEIGVEVEVLPVGVLVSCGENVTRYERGVAIAME
ncbi:MAG: hypothetical protein K6T90_16245 [Leptolyngbyaceae cyanobacterium HOT.MB2.61]|nr:hypothetical protein [Leptolyngbyaceae cyanobacterium HOT.MB2.61]